MIKIVTRSKFASCFLLVEEGEENVGFIQQTGHILEQYFYGVVFRKIRIYNEKKYTQFNAR